MFIGNFLGFLKDQIIIILYINLILYGHFKFNLNTSFLNEKAKFNLMLSHMKK